MKPPTPKQLSYLNRLVDRDELRAAAVSRELFGRDTTLEVGGDSLRGWGREYCRSLNREQVSDFLTALTVSFLVEEDKAPA